MKRLFTLNVLFAAVLAQATTAVAPSPADRTWTSIRSATVVQTGYPTKDACRAVVEADAGRDLAGSQSRCTTDLIFAANDAAPPGLALAPAPAPATWTKATDENKTFTIPAGGQKARFGMGTKWIELFLQPGTYVCAQPATFPRDPAPNIYKECDVLGSAAAPREAPASALAPAPSPAPPPAGSLQVTRTSCTAPCAVLFDATAMGDFRATYNFDFGDPNSGTWPVSGKSKNSEVGGPIAAHVFNAPAVYTPKVNGVAVTVTVADPNVTFAGAKTVCVSPAKDYTGCPSGASQATAYPALPWSGKRVLLHTGESFGAISLLDGNSNLQVGSYGSGAKPIVESVGIGNWRPSSAAFPTDIVVMDLNVKNQISQSLGKRVLIQRNDVHLTPRSGGIPLSIGQVDYWYRGDQYRTVPQGAFYNASEIFLVENNALGSDVDTGVAGFWGEGARIAMLGNRFGRYQMHSARFSGLYKGVIAHNEMQGISRDGIRLALKLHSNGVLPYADTLIADSSGRSTWASSQIVIGNNLFGNAGDNNDWTVEIAPQNNTVGEGIEDVIVENNRFVHGKKTSTDLVYVGRRITLRGNTAVGGAKVTTGTDINAELPATWMGPNYIGP